MKAQRRTKPTLRNYQIKETIPQIHCAFILNQRSPNIGMEKYSGLNHTAEVNKSTTDRLAAL